MVANNQAQNSALSVRDVSIHRGQRILLYRLSFAVNGGDLVWITGSNGSGKTSLLKSIAGLLRQDAGTINIAEPYLSIAYLGHADGHKPTLTVLENLEFWYKIYASDVSVETVMDRVGIQHLGDLEIKKLSAGQSRRVALARLLLKDAHIWLLDEPAAPMDKTGRRLIADLVREHVANDRIALIATHSTPEKIGANARVLRLIGHEDG